jgi:hypothetical protein
MKKLIIIVCGILFATSASASLWSYYTSRGEQLPPISERAIIAETCGISDYSGTYDQNIALEKCLVGEQQLGISLPNVAALFETSLQNSVSADATTMTLVSATLKNGNTLSGLYGFIIDEGSANEEFVICTASSTALSACLRGIDPVDGKTEVSALKYSHRRGASIKITDYPILGIMRRVLNGQEGLPNFLYYDASTTLPTLDGQLATKYYVDTVGAGGFTSANVSTTRGLSVDGSSPERVGINVSSTQGMAFDSSGKLYQKTSSTMGISTDSNGLYIDTSDGLTYTGNNTWTGTNTFNGTTTLATTTGVFSNRTVITATGTSTWTRPTGVTKVKVTLVGGGGNGTNGGSGSYINYPTVGGAGGAFVQKIIDVSATSSVLVTVGEAQTTSSFSSLLTASPGIANAIGIASGGDININGSYAFQGDIGNTFLVAGGNSFLSTPSVYNASDSSSSGVANGQNYGGGGTGCWNTATTGGCTGGTGASGIVIIEY